MTLKSEPRLLFFDYSLSPPGMVIPSQPTGLPCYSLQGLDGSRANTPVQGSPEQWGTSPKMGDVKPNHLGQESIINSSVPHLIVWGGWWTSLISSVFQWRAVSFTVFLPYLSGRLAIFDYFALCEQLNISYMKNRPAHMEHNPNDHWFALLPTFHGRWEEEAAQWTYSRRMMQIWDKMLKPPSVMEKQKKGDSAPQHFGSVLRTLSHGGFALPAGQELFSSTPYTVGASAHIQCCEAHSREDGIPDRGLGIPAGIAVFYHRNSKQKRMTRKTDETSREKRQRYSPSSAPISWTLV